jgi:hypothetical protein
VPLFDAMDGALRHPEKLAELGLTPTERRSRHANGHSDEQAIALLMIALPADQDLIRIRLGKGPSHRNLSEPDATLTKGIPQAAEAAWGLQKCLIAFVAVMDRSCTERARFPTTRGSMRP